MHEIVYLGLSCQFLRANSKPLCVVFNISIAMLIVIRTEPGIRVLHRYTLLIDATRGTLLQPHLHAERTRMAEGHANWKSTKQRWISQLESENCVTPHGSWQFKGQRARGNGDVISPFFHLCILTGLFWRQVSFLIL